MLIDALLHPLSRCEELHNFWGMLDSGKDAALGVASSARPFLIAARFARTPQPTLVIVPGEQKAATFARDIASYIGKDHVVRFFERKDTPFTSKAADLSEVARRSYAIWALSHHKDVVVVASSRALLRCLPPHTSKYFEPIDFTAGKDIGDSPRKDIKDYETVQHALERAGYENTGSLDGPGTFCEKGGAIDIYPGNLSYPVRIDCFGDTVDEIRRIVPTTGQTISSLDAVNIFPCREYTLEKRAIAKAIEKAANPAQARRDQRKILGQLDDGGSPDHIDALLPLLYDHTDTLGAYLSPDVLTVLCEPRGLIDDAIHAYDDVCAKAKNTTIPVTGLYAEPAKLDFGSNQRCTYESIMRVGGHVIANLPVKRTEIAGDDAKLFGRLHEVIDARFTVVFCIPNLHTRKNLALEMVDHDLPIVDVAMHNASFPEKLRRGVVNLVDTDVPLGMIIPKAKLALFSIQDLQSHATLRPSKHVDITDITFPFKPGDYVVHAAHGIALFKDFVRQEINGVSRDYLLLEYDQGDKLFVPVEQLDRVTRYVGPEGDTPRLTRLNTSDWSRAMNRARKASKKLAFDLVDVYARRSSTKGHAYPPDDAAQREMEDAFPYQETPDQLSAIQDVKADMESERPMDRLICGDVGFGKTEVAMRAAFKAAEDHRQVMVLCPTTILAQQHYETFTDRFDPFDITVEVLSRFRTPAQQKAALQGFADGDVDILIGTHRLLSRDVNPHNLGLVIIDEEQRFGVEHKEQFKNLRESVDVLTMSATPIPRTMQMSLSGVRDMSLILTPPDDRLPVKVHVGEWDPDVVSESIRRELRRGGQVYYVSNRVHSIEQAKQRVEDAVPEARVGVAHGQMGKDELETVMEDFAAGKLDVLVATTIIESGIDNPHTNTLIIEDSQRLGLAQLYQLKGRVGRSGLQAYAYFMFPRDMPLTEEAKARLTALSEHQDLGSGMRIAMSDLEIRGAGNMLGAEQSGNISQVGFDLFAQMLAEAVNATREGNTHIDELPPALSDITVNLAADAYIDEDYVPDTDERVMVYRKLASYDTIKDIDDLHDQVEKAHMTKQAHMPEEAENMFARARIKAIANNVGVTLVSQVGSYITIRPCPKPEGDIWRTLMRAGAKYGKRTRHLRIPLSFVKKRWSDDVMESTYQLMLYLFGSDKGGKATDMTSDSTKDMLTTKNAPTSSAKRLSKKDIRPAHVISASHTKTRASSRRRGEHVHRFY